MDRNLIEELRRLADEYETERFLSGDPSWFMHQVEGDANREATAFVASCLSYGSRSQFMPKIKCLLDSACGDIDGWIRRGGFAADVRRGCKDCFYRFYTNGDMHEFLATYRSLLEREGTLGEYVRRRGDGSGLGAVRAICAAFGKTAPVPADAKSACKRVCMFLRWMVRSGSPVDLGLWSGFIDRSTLAMPLDVHVLRQSARLGLARSATASMSAALRLSSVLSEAFPGDPLKGDFALFGYGVSGQSPR